MVLGYIDPGTGFTITSLGSLLLAFLLSFLGILSLFFRKIPNFIKKHKGLFIIICLIVAVLIGILIGVLMNKKASDFDKKIIILGFDGLSPRIIDPMLEKGKLPNFAKLKQQGSYSYLSTTNPSQSPAAWAGFATGQNPGKNGIFDFIIRDPKTYGLSLSLSEFENGKPKKVLKSKSFWEYTSKEKIPTFIIASPVSFPPDKVYGRMLSGMGVPDILGTEGTFTFFTTENQEDKDTGGKVIQVGREQSMQLYLIGPRVTGITETENAKVPFTVSIQKDNQSIQIEYQGNTLVLKQGQWSQWQKVSFNVGLLKNMKGIFKFYLAQISPEFKLYVSPINFDPRSPFFQISHPKNYSKLLAGDIGLYHTQGMPIDTWAVNELRLDEEALLEQANEVLNERIAMLEHTLDDFENGVLFCYFQSSDIIQHMFWRYTDPEHPLYEKNAKPEYKQMIQTWYEKMDSILGDVMSRITEEDTIIALSDHGFDSFSRTVHINSWLRENGYLKLKDKDSESGKELFLDVDWPKTKAYSLGFGAIYINQSSREKQGIVKQGSEANSLKEEIASKLKKWIDKEKNKPVISNVYFKEDIFWGEHLDKTPDLYIGFNIGYRASWQTALGASPKELIEDNLKKWSGSHLFDPELVPGVIFLNQKITKKDPSIYDITPTILKAIGYNEQKLEDCDLDGKPLY
jgi:predicted AlkP superfamily phosphohydrolase/phosphomutase